MFSNTNRKISLKNILKFHHELQHVYRIEPNAVCLEVNIDVRISVKGGPGEDYCPSLCC